MALDDTLAGSIIGVSACLTRCPTKPSGGCHRPNTFSARCSDCRSPPVLGYHWHRKYNAHALSAWKLWGGCCPPEVLRLFGCLRCYDVRCIQILSTDRILFYGHEIHIHMNSLTNELSNCSPDVSFLMKHCLFSESFKLSRTNSLELSV